MPDAAASEFTQKAPWRRRVPRALGRRWAAYWSRWRGRGRSTVEAAFDALASTLADGAHPTRTTELAPCALTLGRAIATASRFRQLDVASEWAQRLLRAQRADGSFSDSAGQPSRFDTSQALRGLAALHQARSEADRWEANGALTDAMRRSAGYLASQFDAAGLPPLDGAAPGSIDRWGPRSLALCWLSPLCSAAQLLDEPAWEQLARRSLRRLVNTADVTRWNAPTQWWAYAIEALVALGESALARAAVRRPAACQTARGDVPALPGERWVSGAGLAMLASAWRQLGGPDACAHADRALMALARRQSPRGGLPATWRLWARSRPASDCPLTAALYLEAVHRQARCALDASAAEFPAEIEAGDARLMAVLASSRALGRGPRIIDVGCGKGRFLRHLRQRLPQATLVGVDLSPGALARLPEGVIGREGDLLRIPASDGEFDAAICIEALEHALLPSRAVAELCRVVRPGGAILIIDKNRTHQALSDHQPWERWFEPQEVAAWLGQHADRIEARPLAHGRRHPPPGLFWCWTATRREVGAHRHAA